jgi:malate dehydrogenase (oxaloacetate-decarboxylating)
VPQPQEPPTAEEAPLLQDDLDSIAPPVSSLQPSASYSITLHCRLPRGFGSLGRLVNAIEATGAVLGAAESLRAGYDDVVHVVTVLCLDAHHSDRVVRVVKELDQISVEAVTDRTFQMHQGGKIAIAATVAVETDDELAMAYTPGVARVCTAIQEDRERARELTIKGNTIAVVSDGTAVLGLGDIGPEAAMPVMEGKALLFKQLGDVDAFPLCLATTDVDEIVAFVKAVAPTFGGINLEDIAAPRCFAIERRLRAELDIPVFHDDQHGTAIVILAALLNALRFVGKQVEDVKVVVVGAGAAGTACTEILIDEGVRNIVVCDRLGAIHRDSPQLDDHHAALAARTNPDDERGSANEVLAGADVFVGLSGPGAVSAAAVRTMAANAIVFAMANPVPELMPEEIRRNVAIVATGRSDYPNQINNVLAFPGVFRGALDVRARTINEEMKLAAAEAIAACVSEEELLGGRIIPSAFDRRVAPAVALAVAHAARTTGAAPSFNS